MKQVLRPSATLTNPSWRSQYSPEILASAHPLFIGIVECLPFELIWFKRGVGVCVTQQAAKKRVLVVEDEILIAMDVEKILSDIDVEVVGPALSLAQAIPLASAEHLHAAVIDINLGTDEVATPVVEILKRRGIPFVFATGYADRIEAKDGPCIGKPFTRAALLEAVGPLLR